MNGNTFGTIFRVTTWGESHGPAVGAVVDGCPAGLPLAADDFRADLARRAGGGASFTTPRQEEEEVTVESGVFEGLTTGTPISLRIANRAQKSSDYEEFRFLPRPGHADLTTHLKQGHRDHRGGGRASARETAARVAAGVVAKKLLTREGISLAAWVERAGPHALGASSRERAFTCPLADLLAARDANALAMPGEEALSILAEVEKLRAAGDSWGGSLACRVEGLPVGLGEPVFDKLGALLGHALLSLPAAVAFEAGGGEAMSLLPGSSVRDPIGTVDGTPRPLDNRHGGLLGGLTTGHSLRLKASFHAPTSVPRPIQTADLRDGSPREITVGGRHDAFPLPRAVPMVEAMVSITIADALLRAGRIPEKL